ncbi:hypothetical protein BN1012_Phect2057 [Candidatus Phaeomarinobacter ectocarpi]|uniref:Uncharacterized protein n=1 Tax=Candidatus Phaeomarinibacter ectocarpi TaxID=1458461 RepID=X5MMC6_9HYPH|nr:hypothetical protein [Candidatus Phaeomarinobacter ectocarpi]CDO60270.1 hypothetical protein BN1012_Phect2057 [Candidatus Phaeomarinobacter ectocarpi]
MDEALLREISEKYLIPFFSGATLEDASVPSASRQQTVAFNTPQIIEFKVHQGDEYRLQVRRHHPFAKKSDPARETQVIDAFVSILAGMSEELTGAHKDDLLSTFQRRVVARAVADLGQETKLVTVIDQVALWSTRLYEGAPIASAIGIDPAVTGSSTLQLTEISEEDFCAVLSNGFDTLLTFDADLKLANHLVLEPTSAETGFCPWRHSAIAKWTQEDAKRIAVVLNRLGEILVFRQGQLLFARRSGNWHFLTHAPVIRQMGLPQKESIRQAIYETALDASFARTGACIGVVGSGASNDWQKTVDEADRLAGGLSKKAQAINLIVGGRNFEDLPRTLRQELAAIDGATVINHKGEILAVGAILKIEGGSTGGGRTAAARQLGKLGLGMKVSQDGGISAYRQSWAKNETVKDAFTVM